MISVIILLGILSVAAPGRYQDLSESAEDAIIDAIYSSVNSYLLLRNGGRYVIAGSPNNVTFVTTGNLTLVINS